MQPLEMEQDREAVTAPHGEHEALAAPASSSAMSSSLPQHQHNHRRHRDHKRRNSDDRRLKPLSSDAVIFRYCGLVHLVVLLTIVCPETDLWKPAFDVNRLVRVIVVYVVTMAAFMLLHNSDPGYITMDAMKAVSQEDGFTVDGRPIPRDGDHNDNDDEEQQRQHTSSMNDSSSIFHKETTSETNGLQRRSVASLSSSDSFASASSSSSPSAAADRRDGSVLGPAATDPLQQPPDTSNSEADTQALLLGGRPQTRRKFCETCQFAPPLRSHHCKVCDKHVAMFDHHCDFVGTCIGARNHCKFWWFLTAQATGFAVCVNIVGSSELGLTTFLHRAVYPYGTTFPWKAALVVLGTKVYLYPLTFVAWLMWGFHTILALTNTTTFEWTKGPRHLEYLKGTRMMDFPYSQRPHENLRQFCCERDSCWENLLFCGSPMTEFKPAWKPQVWLPPGRVIRDSENWWEHPWQNKYWSCC